MWQPEAEDLEQLRRWLLGHPLNSIQHQLARLVISNINFDAKKVTQQVFVTWVSKRTEHILGESPINVTGDRCRGKYTLKHMFRIYAIGQWS